MSVYLSDNDEVLVDSVNDERLRVTAGQRDGRPCAWGYIASRAEAAKLRDALTKWIDEPFDPDWEAKHGVKAQP